METQPNSEYLVVTHEFFLYREILTHLLLVLQCYALFCLDRA
jgi:hypothetical protein